MLSIDKQDVWSLIQNGYFEEACLKADSESANTKNVFSLRNKVFALLHLQRYQEIISLTQLLIDLRNGDADTDFISCGIGIGC